MKNLLNTTLDLIRIPSTTDQPKEIQRIISYVRKFFFCSKDLVVREYECSGKLSMVVGTVDSLTPDILMIGHLDVVPAKSDMFRPDIKGGHLIGRGACDMKSEDAVMMHVLKTVSKDKKPPSVALMLTTDEEVGGTNGVRYLVDKIGYRCKVALVPDGGELSEDIMIESKGAVHIRLTTGGVSAHGSVPWKGKNAIEKLMYAYQKIQKIFPETEPKKYWHTTYNLGIIKGGQATNQVPDQATCTLDIRYPNPVTQKEVVRHIKQTAPECNIEVLTTADASVTDVNDPHLKKYMKLLKTMQNIKPKICYNHSTHDGRFLTSYAIPVIVSRPLSGGQHTDTEWVDIKSLEKFYQLYLSFVRSVA